MRFRMGTWALIMAMLGGMVSGRVHATGAGVPGQIIAHIGQEDITQQDVTTRDRLNHAQPGMATGAHVALFQLAWAACLRDVARRVGCPITNQDLDTEAARIDGHTRMPKKLKELKDLCPNPANYLRLFVLPDFSERWLRAHYYWLHDIHQGPGGQAEAILAQVRDGEKDWAAVAHHAGLEFRVLEISRDGGIHSAGEEDAPVDDRTSQNAVGLSQDPVPPQVAATASLQCDAREAGVAGQLIEKVLAPLQPGVIHDHVIQMEEEFLVLRLKAVSGAKYTAEVIVTPKVPYDTWVTEQFNGLPIAVLDEKAWNAMLTKVPEALRLFAGARPAA